MSDWRTVYETDTRTVRDAEALGYRVRSGRSLGYDGDRAGRWYLSLDGVGTVGIAAGYGCLSDAMAALRGLLDRPHPAGASMAPVFDKGASLSPIMSADGAPLDETSRVLAPALDAFWREVEKQAGRRVRDVTDDDVLHPALELAIAARKAVKAALS